MQWVVMSARVALGMGMSFIESNELNVMSCIDWEISCTECKSCFWNEFHWIQWIALEWVALSAWVALEISCIECNELQWVL